MSVAIVPVTVTTARVQTTVDHGLIERVTAPRPFEGLDHRTHTGERWIPLGLSADLSPGPVTRREAALLLLALAGEDVETVAANLLRPPRRKATA